ncbi:integrase core domain-containing protein [Streptomyces sp. NPDC096339]|uniref:integrase core domain-containing protein n=1 Tax=Streptomyces sp. NPDC096339 TaxID=3366086 RepID=UPI003800138E
MTLVRPSLLKHGTTTATYNALCRCRRPALAAAHDIRLSVGRTGVCWDNALAESFFATLKNELVSQRRWHSRSVARSAIFDYIEGWYNNRRLHSSLGYRSPAEYETTAA